MITSSSIALGVGCSGAVLAEQSLPVWLSVFETILHLGALTGGLSGWRLQNTVAGQIVFSSCACCVGELESS